jgi:hypothetical protein
MAGIRIRITTARRPPEYAPDVGDDALGRDLLGRVLKLVPNGPLPPAVMLLGAQDVRFLYVGPLFAAVKDHHRVVSSLAGLDGVEAVAVLGRFVQRQKGLEPRPLAGVFLEWPDGRWWASWRPLDERGRLLPTDEEEVLRAVDGRSRPGGLGGWFSRARFQGLRADLAPIEVPVANEEPVN